MHAFTWFRSPTARVTRLMGGLGSRSRVPVQAFTVLLISLICMAVTVAPAMSRSLPAARGHNSHRVALHAALTTRVAIDWARYDQAVYAVSTLNLPRCADTQPLSAELQQQDGAHTFDVFRSAADQQLFFIEVRSLTNRLLGVYAYKIGWDQPEGVAKSKCVKSAPDTVVALYKSNEMEQLAHFDSTMPT